MWRQTPQDDVNSKNPTLLFSCVSPALAGSNVTDEELDEMLESGQTDVFTQNVSTHTHTAKGGR